MISKSDKDFFNINEVDPYIRMMLITTHLLPDNDENGEGIDYDNLPEDHPINRFIIAVSNLSSSAAVLRHGIILVPTYICNKYVMCKSGDVEEAYEVVLRTINMILSGYDLEMHIHPKAALIIKEFDEMVVSGNKHLFNVNSN